MKENRKGRPKRQLNIFRYSSKYKKVMAATVSLVIVFAMVMGFVAQFFISY